MSDQSGTPETTPGEPPIETPATEAAATETAATDAAEPDAAPEAAHESGWIIEQALSAIEACLAAGLRVPEDIRVVGSDDIEAAATNKPSLSTVRVDKEALGYAAARALIEGQLEPGNQLFEVALVVRESSRGSEPPTLRARGARSRSR